MKVSFVAEHRGKKIIIPITKKELYNLYEWSEICCDSCGNLDLNKMDLHSIQNKIGFLEHDVVGDGRCYKIKRDKFILQEKRHYLYKKPKWK